MVGASTDIVQIGNYPAKQEVCMTVILGLSQIHTIGHSGSHMDISHHHGLGEQNKQQKDVTNE